jgi:transposase-like protein
LRAFAFEEESMHRIPLAVIEEYKSGKSIYQIAREHGLSGTGVWEVLKRHGIECRGSRNFTDAEEAEIGEAYLSGQSCRAIARAHGLSHHISIVDALRRQGITQRAAPERNRLYPLNPHAFDVIDNEYAAYWWGFIYADGHVSRRTLIVALKYSDKDHLERLRDFMQSKSPILRRYRPGVYHNAHIEFTDRHLAQRLRDLGIITSRPNFILVPQNLPTHLINHWIRGFFDGDGSARKSQSIVFCGAPELLAWIREQLAANAGTNPALAITKHSKARIHYLYIGGRIQALRVADYLYHDATLWMPRKREVVNSWPQ